MIIVKDDFFKDPYSVRNAVLKKKNFSAPENGRYPGLRCDEVSDNINDYILSEARHYTKDPYLKLIKSFIQWIPKKYHKGTVHGDLEKYTSVYFLSLDTPPHSGTVVYDESKDLDPSLFEAKRSFYADTNNFIKKFRFNRLCNKALSGLTPITIPNKFNRFLLFDSGSYHRAENFFGTSIKDSRLTIVSFFV